MSIKEQQELLVSGNLISLNRAAGYSPYSAEYLGLLARKGKLKAVKLNRDWFTTRQIIEDYVRLQEKKHKRMYLKFQKFTLDGNYNKAVMVFVLAVSAVLFFGSVKNAKAYEGGGSPFQVFSPALEPLRFLAGHEAKLPPLQKLSYFKEVKKPEASHVEYIEPQAQESGFFSLGLEVKVNFNFSDFFVPVAELGRFISQKTLAFEKQFVTLARQKVAAAARLALNQFLAVHEVEKFFAAVSSGLNTRSKNFAELPPSESQAIALETKGQGSVLAANTLNSTGPKNIQVQSVELDKAALDLQVRNILDQYAAEGKFKGPKGDPGESALSPGFTGPNGLTPDAYGNNSVVLGGNSIVTYTPPVSSDVVGASLSGFNQMSADTLTAAYGVIKIDLTVVGTTELSDLTVSGAAVLATTTISSLSVDSDINFNGNLYQNGSIFSGSSQWSTGSSTKIYYNLGNVGIGTATPDRALSVVGGIRATGILYDSSNSAGTAGMVLQTSGAGYSWVATSTLGISGGGVSGGTGGYVARFTSATALSSGTLIDNGTVSGVNATSSAVSFNIQGTTTLSPFNISSSTGISLLRVSPNGSVAIGTTTDAATLFVQGASTYASLNPFAVASSTGTNLLALTPAGNLTLAGTLNGAALSGGTISGGTLTSTAVNDVLTANIINNVSTGTAGTIGSYGI